MKRVIFSLSACLLARISAPAQEQLGIHFEEGLSWIQIQAKAKAANKPIFVDCYATWCEPCKWMDKNVYPDAVVAGYFNDHYISVRVQMDTTPRDNPFVRSWRADAQALQRLYHIDGYPALLFLSPEGKVLDLEVGTRSVDKFLDLARAAAEPNQSHGTSGLENGGIHFVEGLSWAELLAKAKTENKFIFVDCCVPWSGDCKEMDRTVFCDPAAAAYFNEHCLSIKMQMVASESDDKALQTPSTDAKKIEQEYKVTSYPTLLFLTPDGKPLHKAIGGGDAKGLIRLAKEASDSQFGSNPDKQYYTRLYRYWSDRDYSAMPQLLFRAASLDGMDAANTIALDYIHSYLAELDAPALLTKDNIEFLVGNRSAGPKDPALGSSGMFFRVLSTEVAKPGKPTDVKKLARDYIDNVIIAEEIDAKLYSGQGKERKVLVDDPDWEGKSAAIVAKYGAKYATRVLPRTECSWYWKVKKDYNLGSKFWLDYIEQDGVVGERMDLFGMNGWLMNLFEKCSDRAILERAIPWGKRLAEENPDSPNVADTYASVLYKAGRTQEAIAVEERAIALAEKVAANRSAKANKKIDPDPQYRAMLEKMKKGVPTWETS